jgi:uncharacterized membrane protein
MSLSSYLLVFTMVALISLAETGAQLCFKTAVERLDMPASNFRQMLMLSWRLLFFVRVWIGMWLGLAILGLWIAVLKQSDLHFAFCLSSIHYIFIALGSKFVLKEHVSRNRWWATLMITIGIAIVSIS